MSLRLSHLPTAEKHLRTQHLSIQTQCGSRAPAPLYFFGAFVHRSRQAAWRGFKMHPGFSAKSNWPVAHLTEGSISSKGGSWQGSPTGVCVCECSQGNVSARVSNLNVSCGLGRAQQNFSPTTKMEKCVRIIVVSFTDAMFGQGCKCYGLEI